MATKFFPINTASGTSITGTSAVTSQVASLTAGSGLASVTTNTANGAISCASSIVFRDSGGVNRLGFLSVALDAVTISGTITANLWMDESAMAANAGAEIYIFRCSNAGAWIANILGCDGTNTTSAGTTPEFGTELPFGGSRTAQNWTATPASTTLSAGDRIGMIVKANDAGGTMASGSILSFGYSGATGAADGDSWIQFTETIVEQPAAGFAPIAGFFDRQTPRRRTLQRT